MATSKSRAIKGYGARDSGTHRKYNYKASIKRYNKTKKFTYRGTKVGGKVIYGLGHKAGENWGAAKGIDPDSVATKYSKNSPSFDEGVYKYKEAAKAKALQKKQSE